VAAPQTFDRFIPLSIDDGLRLRAVAVDDAAPLSAMVQANRDHLATFLVDLVEEIRDVHSARAHLERVVGDRARGTLLEMHIEEHGVLCGAVRLRSLDWTHRSANIGYFVAASHQGRGIVTRVVSRFVEWAFTDLGLHRIELRCARGNAASSAVASRLGFTLEGRLRDAERLASGFTDILVYSRLCTDPAPAAR
jgi:ribosomal-protein-serine acetyltransferase